MSRGLGKQQRKVVKALRRVEAKQGAGWVSPGDVLVKLERPTGDPRLEAMKLTFMLINVTNRAAQGDPHAAALVEDLERQGASRSSTSNAFSPPKPMGKRLTPPRRRNCERINPARIFAALEKRGIVERLPRVANPSRGVRLARASQAASTSCSGIASVRPAGEVSGRLPCPPLLAGSVGLRGRAAGGSQLLPPRAREMSASDDAGACASAAPEMLSTLRARA